MTVLVNLCVRKLKSHFWVIYDWFRLTIDEWRNKSPKEKPNWDLCSMFNKVARTVKEKDNAKSKE